MSFQGFDNYIQREIFLKLRTSDVARYSELNIKTIESSQFMYHLKELIKAGLVEKVDKGKYRLTHRGIALSQNFSTDKKNLSMAPLTYSLIFARSKDGNWLILKRGKQPFINAYACLSGKVHMHETLTVAAKREWEESVSDSAPKLEYRGIMSVIIREPGEVITHIAGPVWFADGIEEEWKSKETSKGVLQWTDWQSLDYSEFIPGWKELVESIEVSDQPFMLDMEFTL